MDNVLTQPEAQAEALPSEISVLIAIPFADPNLWRVTDVNGENLPGTFLDMTIPLQEFLNVSPEHLSVRYFEKAVRILQYKLQKKAGLCQD